MTLKEALDKAVDDLKEIENGSQKVNYLAQEIFSLSYTDLVLNKDQILDQALLDRFQEAVQQIKNHKPEAYILGYQYFCNLKFKVNNNVLIPRPETEQLVEMAADIASQHFKTQLNFIDLGCGSGCIGVSLAHKLSYADGLLLDISKEAIDIAQENSKALLGSPLACVNSAAESYVPDKIFDLILGNPPYIKEQDAGVSQSTYSHEPHLALYAKGSGLALVKSWMSHYVKFMNPKKSYMIFEVGYGQGDEVLKFSQSLNVFKNISIVKDLYGKDRFFLGEVTKE